MGEVVLLKNFPELQDETIYVGILRENDEADGRANTHNRIIMFRPDKVPTFVTGLMKYAFYRCSEGCDGKPCFVAYPEDERPPKRCVASSGSCNWEPVELNEFVEAVFGAGEGLKVDLEFEKLRLIAEYFEFPVAVFFTSVKWLKKLKGRTLSEDARKALRKLEKIREILEGDV